MSKTTLKLGVLATLWLIAVNIGSFGTDDTDLRLRMGHAWWSGASEVSSRLPQPISREDALRGVRGAGGKRYVFYDPGQSILMMPGDWLASKMDHWVSGADGKDFRTQVVDRLTPFRATVRLKSQQAA